MTIQKVSKWFKVGWIFFLEYLCIQIGFNYRDIGWYIQIVCKIVYFRGILVERIILIKPEDIVCPRLSNNFEASTISRNQVFIENCNQRSLINRFSKIIVHSSCYTLFMFCRTIWESWTSHNHHCTLKLYKLLSDCSSCFNSIHDRHIHIHENKLIVLLTAWVLVITARLNAFYRLLPAECRITI